MSSLLGAGVFRCYRCGRCYLVDEHEEAELRSTEFCPACIEVLAEGLLLCPTEPLPPLQ